jgi:effector-binding domain-containing protein
MSVYDISRATLQAEHVALVRAHVAHDGIGDFLGGAFAEVMSVVEQQGRRPVGAPFGRYRMTDGGFDVEAGFPVDAPVTAQGRVEPGTLPGGTVARAMYRGPYDGVAAAYDAVIRSVQDSGDQVAGDPWECYLDGPEVPEPRTEVFVPCQPAVARHAGS